MAKNARADHGANVHGNNCDRDEPHDTDGFHTDQTTGVNWVGPPPSDEE